MTGGIKRIVLVEDTLAESEAMRKYLETRSADYELKGIADTVDKALKLIKDTLPHIIILDMRLSGEGDGSDIVEELKKMELSVRPQIFAMSENPFYHSYCVRNSLMFLDKTTYGYNPEKMFKRIERYLLADNPYAPVETKPEIEAPIDKRKRIENRLYPMFAEVGAHTCKGYEDVIYIVTRMVENAENGDKKRDPLNDIYMERARETGVTKDAIEGRIRHMLQSLWVRANPDALKKFYPPDLGQHKYSPTNLAFILYFVDMMRQEI